MGEGWHEKNGWVGQEGFEDASVPAGEDAKEEAREKLGCQDCS